MLCRDAGGLQPAGCGRDPGGTVHHGGPAVPRVSAAVPRLTAEQTAVDVSRSGSTEVRTAFLCVGAEIA